MQPLVSIYIPTKNRPDMLRRAVFSCLTQTYTKLEILIVDDGSDEAAIQTMQKLQKQDSRIVLLSTDNVKGACAARNIAIFAATGEFVTGLDDDDEFEPTRIDSLVHAWASHSNIGFICTGYQVITKTGGYRYGSKQRFISEQDLLFANYVGNQLFCPAAHMRGIGGFDESMPSCQDYDAWIRLSEHYGGGVRIKQTSYIVHQEHDSPRISAHRNRVKGYDILLSKHRSKMSEAQHRSQLFYRTLYAESWSPMDLLKASGRYTWGVACKNILLNWLRKLKVGL